MMDHRDAAEEQLSYADPMITGNPAYLLQAALTHAILALVDQLAAFTGV